MVYHALIINDGIITDVLDSDKPVTSGMFSENQEYINCEIVQISDRKEYQAGQPVLAYTPDGVLRPIEDRINNGLAEIPPGFQMFDGKLMPNNITEEDAPKTMIEKIKDMENKMLAIQEENDRAIEALLRVLLETDIISDKEAMEIPHLYKTGDWHVKDNVPVEQSAIISDGFNDVSDPQLYQAALKTT